MPIRRTLALFAVATLAGSSLVACGGSSDGDERSAGKKDDVRATSGPSGTGSRTLNALFYTEGADGPEGGTNPVVVNVTNEGKGVRVSFTEDEVGGTGDQWRAAGWNAVAVSTMLTGASLSGRKVEFEVTGRIDGPSAGALMTVGILSTLRGDRLKDDVTMTGTINPDGTVGPVGGIPFKVDGVKKAGKKRMLIPIGQRNSHLDDGSTVDVVALGRRKGIEVTEVSNIYEVYRAFTGKELPRPAEASDVRLDDRTYDRLKAKVKGLTSEANQSYAEYQTLAPPIREVLDPVVEQAVASAEEAGKLSDNGLQAGAFVSALEASAFMNATLKTGHALQVYFTQGVDAFVSQIQGSQQISLKVEGVVDGLKTFEPATVADAAALIDAYSNVLDAVSLSTYGDSMLGQVSQAPDEETAMTMALMGALYYEVAGALVDASEDLFGISRGLGGARLDPKMSLSDTADFFRKASESNLNAFDSLIIEQIAEANQASADAVKVRFGSQDIDYALAQSSLTVLMGGLDEYFGDADTADYAKLGGSTALYARSAQLLMKYYSLDAELDDDLNVVDIKNQQALSRSLEFGADQVKRGVSVLRSEKVDPALVVAGYEKATIDREGDPSAKLDALGSYLAGFISGRVLAYLGGFPTAGLDGGS